MVVHEAKALQHTAQDAGMRHQLYPSSGASVCIPAPCSGGNVFWRVSRCRTAADASKQRGRPQLTTCGWISKPAVRYGALRVAPWAGALDALALRKTLSRGGDVAEKAKPEQAPKQALLSLCGAGGARIVLYR